MRELLSRAFMKGARRGKLKLAPSPPAAAAAAARKRLTEESKEWAVRRVLTRQRPWRAWWPPREEYTPQHAEFHVSVGAYLDAIVAKAQARGSAEVDSTASEGVSRSGAVPPSLRLCGGVG
eukprot:jgi/Mesen1/1192/ME001272S00369